MDKIQENTTALLIISLDEAFANSYRLVNVLSRKFNLLNFVEIIKRIEDAKFVSSDYKNGVANFTLTPLGINFLEKNRLEVVSKLKDKFPDEFDFIEHFS